MEEELSAVEEIGDEVEALGALEGVVQLGHERMRDLLHDVTLNLRVRNLIRLDDEVLLEGLDGVDLAIVLFLGHVDFAEGAAAHDLQELEVFYLERYAWLVTAENALRLLVVR